MRIVVGLVSLFVLLLASPLSAQELSPEAKRIAELDQQVRQLVQRAESAEKRADQNAADLKQALAQLAALIQRQPIDRDAARRQKRLLEETCRLRGLWLDRVEIGSAGLVTVCRL